MYQALYRKWRPRVFEDVAGQPNITTTLKNEIIFGRIGHAYIFTGSRGTGKTTCAKILAKAVNCLNPHDGDPCGQCENCRGIDSGSSLDVVEIDAASNNGVDNIRDLREETAYTPASAKYRVYIIDEAHMLSAGAFNALLKTLEEPPSYVIFILATTEVHKIPATVMSRCQRFDFRRIPNNDIVDRLNFVAEQENIKLDEAGAAMIARVADGGLRDALSLLDQCAGNGELVDENRVAAAAGLTGREYLFELSSAVAKRDNAVALKIIDGLYSASKDVERLCEELIGHFRDLMIVKSVKNPFDIIACRSDEAIRLQESAQEFSIEDLLHSLDTLQTALETLRRASSGRVGMEICLMRLCSPELDTTSTALLSRIKTLEDKIASASFAPHPNSSVTSDQSTTTSDKAVADKSVDDKKNSVPRSATTQSENVEPVKEGLPSSDSSADEPLNCWAEVLEALRKSDAPLFGVLKTSSAIIRGGFVLIDPNNSMFVDLIRAQEHRKPLVESVRHVTGKPYKVGIFKKSIEAAASKPDDLMDELAENASRAGIDVEQH